jgi:hypothetical protein
MILLRQGVKTKSQTVSLSTVRLREYGITRWQKETALDHLVRAGLITVVTQHGKNPWVTLLALE